MLRRATVVLLVALSGWGCGGGSGGIGVDPAKPFSATSDTDKARLCDWFAGQLGGYGAAPTCARGLVSSPQTQQDCVLHFPSCDVTVGQYVACLETVFAAQAICGADPGESVDADEDCQVVSQAGCLD
jgi:hypothetical protein